jgi:hypothetical protein
MKKLYRFRWNADRGGSLTGIFVASPEAIEEAIGEVAYFGEVLGKHSCVRGVLDRGDISEVECSEGFAEEFARIVRSVGYNPLDYLYLPHPEDDPEGERDCPEDRMCETCWHGQHPGFAAQFKKPA